MTLQRTCLPVLFTAITAFALSGCKTDLSKVTDEQLVVLLGNDRDFLSLSDPDENEPVTISRRVRECAEILGGLNAEIYKDGPQEIIGSFKVDCRKAISEWLADPERNHTELQLADFERKALAERIIALAEKQDAAKEAYQRSEREKEIEQIKTELTEVTAAGEYLKAAVVERQDILNRECEKLAEKQDALEQKNSSHNLRYQSLPNICVSDRPFDLTMSRIEGFEARLAEYTLPKPNSLFMNSPPPLPFVDLDEMDAEITEIRDLITKYEAALAEN